MTDPGTRRVEVLYDRDCGFCVWCVDRLERLDRRGRVTATPLQQPGAPQRFGVGVEQALEQVWALDGRGRRYGGAAAVNAALSAALGVRVPWWLYRIPGVRQLQDAAYRLVSRNRHRLPGHGGSCAIG